MGKYFVTGTGSNEEMNPVQLSYTAVSKFFHGDLFLWKLNRGDKRIQHKSQRYFCARAFYVCYGSSSTIFTLSCLELQV